MDDKAPKRAPLFELPVVLLPGELMPLHIFEERYERMIGHCLETEEPFGVVFREDDGSARRDRVRRPGDRGARAFRRGRIDIVVTGEEPSRSSSDSTAQDYPAGEVEASGPREFQAEDPEARRRTREAFANLVRRVSGAEPEIEGLDRKRRVRDRRPHQVSG